MRLFHLEIVSHDILLEFLVHIGISGEHRLKSFAFLTVKVVLRDFCHKTAQRNQAYQVRHSHQTVKGVVDRPDKLAVDRRGNRDQQYVNDLERDDYVLALFLADPAETEFNSLFAVVRPRDDRRKCKQRKDNRETQL